MPIRNLLKIFYIHYAFETFTDFFLQKD